MKAQDSHRDAAPKQLGFYIVTVSSSRYAKKNAAAGSGTSRATLPRSSSRRRGTGSPGGS